MITFKRECRRVWFTPVVTHPLGLGSSVFDQNNFIKSDKWLCGKPELVSATPWLMATGLWEGW